MLGNRLPFALLLMTFVGTTVACNRGVQQQKADTPRISSKVQLRDVTFYSPALRRNAEYRAIYPAQIAGGQQLPTVYLLHGGGGSFRDWSNYSDVSKFAEHNLVLIMPDADESYYTNSATRSNDRYEDYVVRDLVADVERRFPVAHRREMRAIVGVSMGGFGAVKLGLKYPALFGFIGGLSSAIDVPSRPFSIRRIGQWRHHESIFGPWKSEYRCSNDPFVLARSVNPANVGYIYLTCGTREGLLASNRQLASILEQRNFDYEFHIVPGGHDWNQWNAQLPDLFKSLMAHISADSRVPSGSPDQ